MVQQNLECQNFDGSPTCSDSTTGWLSEVRGVTGGPGQYRITWEEDQGADYLVAVTEFGVLSPMLIPVPVSSYHVPVASL